MKLLPYLAVIVTFFCIPLVSMGIFKYMQKYNTGYLQDLYCWFFIFSIPIVFTNFAITSAWRYAMMNGLTGWTIHLLAAGASAFGSALALYLYLGEIPSWTKLIAFVLIFSGVIVNVLFK
jgi:hypothetical protein